MSETYSSLDAFLSSVYSLDNLSVENWDIPQHAPGGRRMHLFTSGTTERGAVGTVAHAYIDKGLIVQIGKPHYVVELPDFFEEKVTCYDGDIAIGVYRNEFDPVPLGPSGFIKQIEVPVETPFSWYAVNRKA